MSAHIYLTNSSSSSEDEAEYQRLASAVWKHSPKVMDYQFPKKALQMDSHRNGRHKYVSHKPSMRQQINEEYQDQFNEDHKNVIATPEFRDFVAKKLSAFLDKSVETVTSAVSKPTEESKAEENEDTFKLLSTSCCVPNTSSPLPLSMAKRKRPYIGRRKIKLSAGSKDNSSDSEVENQRLAEAAISGQKILSAASSKSTRKSNTLDSEDEGSDDGKDDRDKSCEKRDHAREEVAKVTGSCAIPADEAASGETGKKRKKSKWRRNSGEDEGRVCVLGRKDDGSADVSNGQGTLEEKKRRMKKKKEEE